MQETERRGEERRGEERRGEERRGEERRGEERKGEERRGEERKQPDQLAYAGLLLYDKNCNELASIKSKMYGLHAGTETDLERDGTGLNTLGIVFIVDTDVHSNWRSCCGFPA